MPPLPTLIGGAWRFYHKHPVLNPILGWMFVLPLVLATYAFDVVLPAYFPELKNASTMAGLPAAAWVSLLLTNLVISVWMVWSGACVLVVGRRIIKSPAGRSRTSFPLVLRQASPLVLPLLLTGILRAALILLWSLLLIVPGVIYAIRTVFYQVAIVCEGKEYQASLHRSTAVVRGRTWEVFWYLLGLGLLVMLLGMGVGLAESALLSFDRRLFLVATVLGNFAVGLSIVLFLLITVVWYRELTKPQSTK